MNKITILIDTIRGHAGGPASIFDMATTLSTIGNEVHPGLISFDPFYIYRRKQLVRKKFDSEIKPAGASSSKSKKSIIQHELKNLQRKEKLYEENKEVIEDLEGIIEFIRTPGEGPRYFNPIKSIVQ